MTMSFQAHDGHAAHCSEDLHRHILQSHLAYLNQEETPAKLEQRRNLESLISEFLCIVSHNAKFTFVEVGDILNQSIKKNINFSAYKAQSAFEALEKYATNLISHPWRREYKMVKLYSGFYKHSVENQLVQGNSVLHLLGYQYMDDGVLFLDEPVDPEKVARVALDCLTACVECQIMVQICEKLKSFKCSWVEIHSVREDYVCGIDEAVRLLHQLKRNALEHDRHERWMKIQENGSILDNKKEISSSYPKTGILVDVSNTGPNEDNYLAYRDNSALSQSGISDGHFKVNKSILSHSKLPSWSESISSHLDHIRDICTPFSKVSIESGISKSSRYIPTVNSPYNFCKVNGSESSKDTVLRLDVEKLQHSKRGSYYDNVPTFVENESIVSEPSLNSKCDLQSSNGIVIPTISLTLLKPRSHHQNKPVVSVTESVGNSHSLKLQKKSTYCSNSASFGSSVEKSLDVATSDSKSIVKTSQTPIVAVKDSKGSSCGRKWSCTSCTFHNAADKSICDMCGRSKHPGPEITPLMSGGRECPQCTLVNKKDSENCTACGASLKDSPTYI